VIRPLNYVKNQDFAFISTVKEGQGIWFHCTVLEGFKNLILLNVFQIQKGFAKSVGTGINILCYTFFM